MNKGTGVERDIADLLGLGERLRARIDQRIDYLKRQDRVISVQQQFVITWTLALMILAWDVSDSILTLARNGNHVRAIQILSRALFEYATRLEFYYWFPEDAEKHGMNSVDWLAQVIQKNSYRYDLDNIPPEQRANIENLLAHQANVIKPQFLQMLERIYKKRGHSPEEVTRLCASQYNDFYAAASSMIHGNQGVYPEMFYKDATGGYEARHKAIDSDQTVALKNVVAFLLRMNYAFCLHNPQFDDDDLREEFRDRFDMKPEDVKELNP